MVGDDLSDWAVWDCDPVPPSSATESEAISNRIKFLLGHLTERTVKGEAGVSYEPSPLLHADGVVAPVKGIEVRP